MESQGESDCYVLFVTGPLRQRLYQRFRSLFDGHEDVVVRIDRRVSDRRHDSGRLVAAERRAADRRRRRPDWIVPPPDGI